MAKAAVKVFPDKTLADACRAAGARVRVVWEEKGPPNTGIEWQTCYLIGPGLCIVQTFTGGGWEAFTAPASRDIPGTIADVLNRCGAPVKD